MVTFNVQLPEEQALALALLMKRLTFDDCRSRAVDDEQAYTMIYATEAVRTGLSNVGYNPR